MLMAPLARAGMEQFPAPEEAPTWRSEDSLLLVMAAFRVVAVLAVRLTLILSVDLAEEAKLFLHTHDATTKEVLNMNYEGMERRVTPRREDDIRMADAERVEMELKSHIDICAIRYEGIEKQFIGVNARLKRIEAAGWKGLIAITGIMLGGMGTILWAILRSAHGGI